MQQELFLGNFLFSNNIFNNESISWISILGLVIAFAISRVNNLGNTTLEIKLSSNWERLKDFVFLFLIFALLFTGLFWIIFLGKESILICATLGLLYFSLILCLSYLLSFFYKKDTYFIRLKNDMGDELWELIRYSGKKGYLLRREVELDNEITVYYHFKKDIVDGIFILKKERAPIKKWISKRS